MNISTILLVEDDEFHRKVLKSLLSTLLDAEIYCAENGLEALKVLTKIKPDIIFCDLFMPRMDGVEFSRHLGNLYKDCTLVFTSSIEQDVQEAVVDMSRSYGIRHVMSLPKPIHREAIERLLHSLEQDTHTNKPKRKFNEFEFSDTDLVNALRTGEFEPHFQAHFNAKNGHLVGAEALLRWHHAEHGTLTPASFLSQLMELGLSYQLTCHMIRRSVELAMALHRNGQSLQLAVNVSPSDLEHDDFAQRVIRILDELRYPPHKLTLEMTETELATDLAKILENTSRLRLRGVSISIDDFGTGHSSLSQLLSSPFTELKIDRFFINEMLTSEKHLATINCVITLAKSLKLKVVAEGVENRQQAQKLAQLGCDVLQGYYLAKPKPFEEFAHFVEDYNKRFAPIPA